MFTRPRASSIDREPIRSVIDLNYLYVEATPVDETNLAKFVDAAEICGVRESSSHSFSFTG